MKVFRLEYKPLGQGVYNAFKDESKGISEAQIDGIFKRYFGGTMASAKHPFPSDDTKLAEQCEKKFGINAIEMKWGVSHRAGFTSLEQLRAWFYADAALIELGKLGIVLSVYDVPRDKLARGNSQAAFDARFHTKDCLKASYDLVEVVEKGFDKLQQCANIAP